MNEGPALTLAEAAKQSTMSKTTLRRRLHADQIDGAERADDGSWSIPIASLVQAGLLRATSPPDSAPSREASEPVQGVTDEAKPTGNDSVSNPGNLRVNIAKPGTRTPPPALAVELTTLRHRAELAEHDRDAVRSELERADRTIQDLRRNVDQLERMLPAGPVAVDPAPATQSTDDLADEVEAQKNAAAAALESTIEILRSELEVQRRTAAEAQTMAEAGWRERRRLRKAARSAPR